MSMEYIRRVYGVPAKRGGKVRITSMQDSTIKLDGIIVASKGPYIRVRINDGKPMSYHPTWNIEYLREEATKT